MDRCHISFLTLPHSPHVFPTLPIVRTLIQRGHRVSYVTSERFVSSVKESGADVILCPSLQLNLGETVVEDESESPADAFQTLTLQTLKCIDSALQQDKPDLILYDFMSFPGRILAKRWSIPAIQTSPFYAFDNSKSFESQIRHAGFREQLVTSARVSAEFLRRHGVASQNYRVDKEDMNIYLFPGALQPNRSAFGNDCLFAGRCPAERPANGSWQDHSGGRPIALVAMSTLIAVTSPNSRIPVHFELCLQALAGLGWHVVLSIGERCDASALMPLPAHCEMIPHTSYLDVLPRSKLLFFMSGIISTAEAAYHGVPMIAITDGFAEYEWQADHLVDLGIGAHIRKDDTTVQSLRETAIRMSRDSRILQRVREFELLVKAEPGAEEAADCIENYLASRLNRAPGGLLSSM